MTACLVCPNIMKWSISRVCVFALLCTDQGYGPEQTDTGGAQTLEAGAEEPKSQGHRAGIGKPFLFCVFV